MTRKKNNGGGVLDQERLQIRSGTLNEPIKGFLNSTSEDLTVSTMRVTLKGAFGCRGQSLIKSLMVRDWMYFLADGIYPNWSIFVKTIRHAVMTMEEVFKTSQESTRKDIERAFGVLVKRFHYLKRPLRNWYLKDTKSILDCCIIMHNMIVECRRHAYMAATNGFDIPIPNDDLEQEVEEPINFTSLFGCENVADGHNEAIAGELADRVSTVLGNVKDIQKYNKLRSDLMTHKIY
jgi:hypothetical protein